VKKLSKLVNDRPLLAPMQGLDVRGRGQPGMLFVATVRSAAGLSPIFPLAGQLALDLQNCFSYCL